MAAEAELMNIRHRTKSRLAEAKIKGVKLGTNGKVLALNNKVAALNFAQSMQSIVNELKSEGFISMRDIAKELRARKIKTAQGKSKWHANSVF